ncbi:MAG TPA: hypothetical protein DCF63_01765 [Planctomycetaceae bacterium]|nr:hypothetical protein [Planctomycetaceae bacterium]
MYHNANKSPICCNLYILPSWQKRLLPGYDVQRFNAHFNVQQETHLMKRLNFLFALVLSSAAALDAYAGCGICRRGGCSDPCTASACTGVAYHQGSYGGCASMSGVVHSGCGAAAAGGCAISGNVVNYSQPSVPLKSLEPI